MDAFKLRIYVPCHKQQVGKSVVVRIEKAASPAHEVGLFTQPRGTGNDGEGGVPIVMKQVYVLIGEIGFDNIQPAIVIVVRSGYTHACLGFAIFTETHTRSEERRV